MPHPVEASTVGLPQFAQIDKQYLTHQIPLIPPILPHSSPLPLNPKPQSRSTPPWTTRYRVGTNRPTQRYTLYVSTISPIPKSYNHAFQDPHWYRAMLDEYNALIKNNTWILVPSSNRTPEQLFGPYGFSAHKYNADGLLLIVNKARLVAVNGSTLLTSIDLDVKNAFLHGSLSETVYMQQPPGFRDSQHPDHVCLLQRSLYGLKQAPRAWGSDTVFTCLFYVDDIILTASYKACLNRCLKQRLTKVYLMSFDPDCAMFVPLQQNCRGDVSSIKHVYIISHVFASTPVDLEKPLVKDGDADDIDVHLYRSMIGSLMYLTTSRPDIMFAVCACARFQVTLKTSHLLVVKRIFRYLKGKPTLGLWYSRDSPFELVAYTDSDYSGATQDRKSIIGGCQFLGNRLISWQCKKQTVVATSTTEAKNVATASCYLLTKGFDAGRFQYLVSSIGMLNP
ncbi:putative ribonuclease H-like domain-containing protein [Tanacetum coccineum]